MQAGQGLTNLVDKTSLAVYIFVFLYTGMDLHVLQALQRYAVLCVELWLTMTRIDLLGDMSQF